jgi:hypothetical protein
MGEDLKAIQDTLRGVRGWLVVLEGKAAGVWTGVKPLAALKLVKGKKKRLPPHRKAEDLTKALAIWFAHREDWPVVGAGRHLVLRPGAEEYEALFAFLPEARAHLEKGRLAPKRAEERDSPRYLLRTDGSYSDRQNAMGFAVAVYAREGKGYKEVGRVQGGNVGWGGSRVAEYGSIAIGLTLLPAGASVLVESDLEDLVLALQGKAQPNGEVGPYFAVIQEAIRAKGLKVVARKARRGEVVVAHQLANGGREELARSGPLMDFLRMVKVGGRASVFEALRALPSPEAEIPGEAWEAERLRYLRERVPELFAEAWRVATRMRPDRAEAFAEELRLASMRSKPPTEGQVRLLVSLGREVPRDRAEAYLAIREIVREGRRRKEGRGSSHAPPLEDRAWARR